MIEIFNIIDCQISHEPSIVSNNHCLFFILDFFSRVYLIKTNHRETMSPEVTFDSFSSKILQSVFHVFSCISFVPNRFHVIVIGVFFISPLFEILFRYFPVTWWSTYFLLS